MRPASCQKLVTAITALHFLSGNYQLRTDFRITGNVTGGVLNGDLCIVGGMDPLVNSEELLQAAATIKQQQGIESIAGNLIYDLSMREDAPLGWGWCWDDDYGPLSALLVDGKDTFEQNWLQALSKAGIHVSSQVGQRATANKQSRSVYTIRHSIDEVLEPMMKNSDNIIAECLFYQIAASTGQKNAGHKQATKCTEELLREIGLEADNYKVADGSGLSLYNYVSAEMLVAMLCYAWRTPSIREHLLPSLPIAGFDGTLQKRMIGTEAEGNVRAKTGTVTGIVSLAGYLTATNGHTLAFCIINQGVSSSSIGRDFQDEVCQELCR
jgi:D-alanyl-D-alanine carboxypeptidase/D-alanyl-D-alanine-endopeptidase (penicillin-binding protein 4)